MPRIRRFLQDGLAYHVLNRGNRRSAIFHQPADYLEFLTTMVDAMAVVPMRVLAFCLLSNHFHLVLWPDDAHDLSTYMRCFMNRHVRRYHARHGSWGSGHLYQGRFKSFPIQTGGHLLTVLRYVEANAVKAGLASRAEDWPWSSLARERLDDGRPLITPSPVPRPPDWLSMVNDGLSAEALFNLRYSLHRQLPFGQPEWSRRVKEAHDMSPGPSAREGHAGPGTGNGRALLPPPEAGPRVSTRRRDRRTERTTNRQASVTTAR